MISRWPGRFFTGLSKPRRGTTLLYVTGISAVLLILLYGLSESTLRSFVQVRRANQRSEAEWIVQAGIVWGRLHHEQLRQPEKLSFPLRCGTGGFTCRLETDPKGKQWLVVHSSVPFDQPRVTATGKAPVVSDAPRP